MWKLVRPRQHLLDSSNARMSTLAIRRQHQGGRRGMRVAGSWVDHPRVFFITIAHEKNRKTESRVLLVKKSGFRTSGPDSSPAEGGGGGLSCGWVRGRVGGRRQQPIVRVGAAWPTRGWGHRAPRMVVPSRLRLTTINHISCCPPSATSRDFSYNCSQCTAFASTWLHLHLWPS